MTAFAIMRLRKRKVASAAAMARHALRDGGPEVRNADPSRKGANRVLVGPNSAPEAIAALKASLPSQRRKDAVTAIELLISASPEAMRGKSDREQDRYFAESLHWIGQRFGGFGNIKLAVVHRDETTPHMQVLVVPLVDGRLVGNKLIGGPAGLRSLQTDFAQRVGSRHGLVRGVEVKPGEARPAYQSIRRWYAAIAAAGSVDRIPPVVTVPPMPAKPQRAAMGLLEGLSPAKRRAAKAREADDEAEYERQVKARKGAIAANRARTELVGQLASIGLAVYGKAARGVGERLADAQRADKAVSTAKATLGAAADDLVRLEKEIEARSKVLKLGVLEQRRDELETEISALERKLRAARPR